VRIVPGNTNGLLVSDLPESLDELAALFRGAPPRDPVRALRLVGPGMPLYRPTISVRWRELPRRTAW
jgi:hypothetical protein